jgi:hypothetical protein
MFSWFSSKSQHWLLRVPQNLGQKKRGSAESQSFVNLKSNTMKNTMQRYEFLPILPKLYGTSF